MKDIQCVHNAWPYTGSVGHAYCWIDAQCHARKLVVGQFESKDYLLHLIARSPMKHFASNPHQQFRAVFNRMYGSEPPAVAGGLAAITRDRPLPQAVLTFPHTESKTALGSSIQDDGLWQFS